MRLLAIGDNCVDNYAELGRRFPGGNALNVAVYASRVPGVHADYVGAVGADENGGFMVDQIRAQGLDPGKVLRWAGETAVTTILIRGGERVFAHYLEGVQKDATLPPEALPDPRGYDLIHFSVWGFGREHIPYIRETSGALLSCDFSNQLDDPRTGIMQYLDCSFFSGRHLAEKGVDPEAKIRELKQRTPGVVAMTLGEYGSLVYDGDKMYRGRALPVEVVDTLGAGDSWIASFLCGRLQGESIEKSIKEGHQAAAETCGRLGAWGRDP
ncbi:MAG: PfkB family carbohydrate kinase [Candidatus Bathyarchaeota archaeon]